MKDIFDTIKERLSNPFIGSYVISWFICNWQIPLGLIWYNATNIEKFGYKDYRELIYKNTDNLLDWLVPLIIALLYTFLLPLIKTGINYFNAKVDRVDKKNILKISETASIPTT